MGLISWLKNKFNSKQNNETNLTSNQENVSNDENVSLEQEEFLKEFSSSIKEQESNLVEEKNDKGKKLTKKEKEKIRKKELIQTLKQKRKEAKLAKKEEKKNEKENKKLIDNKYIIGLDKSHQSFSGKLKKLTKEYKELNSQYLDELERILIEADVGVKLTLEILDQVEKECNARGIKDTSEINDILIDKMFIGYINQGGSFNTDLKFDNKPEVLLVVGVNGTGKTTTIAKLSKRYKDKGKKILLIAADTFRAGAITQLKTWADRVGVDFFSKEENSDPASVCYEGLNIAKNNDYDLVIIDTAGRLHNKTYLMDELGKVIRVIKKVDSSYPHETFLVIDANTGQNGIEQAKVFKEVCPLTGVVITKMDGTSKGGIILAIRDMIQTPVRFIGLGEGMDDLKEFDLDMYLYGLLIGSDED